ncbi:ATP-binding protein [Mucilaginibacter ginsenosidivorax]|uniref:AAA family ATPase n=1 Tax=Mucilaginibacter ginsenosidivorax TaxID=862126 RepID=A0A5B8W4Y1_9SPHI|nr:ATP-binding protein [Mucilaginibacter ginsenosidivorax]QEC78609.1 AAA family ATPase [Mucilaginibacter ginsenosidivorax]
MSTIEELRHLRESEDKIEFKAAKNNFEYSGGKHTEQSERRKCFLGYVVALCNEGGGRLVLGLRDHLPHETVGSNFGEGKINELIDETYERLGIRVSIEELHENGLRVVVVTVPGRPIGKLMKFEGVPLMRTGESLRNMSDEQILRILLEQEPDFSATLCRQISIDDLDPEAIAILKDNYAAKQRNDRFKSLGNVQALSDLELIRDDKLTYAALILLGKRDVIHQYLPQAKIIIEYRSNESSITHEWREEINAPLFIGIQEAWRLIHSRNIIEHNNLGPYIFDTPVFDEIVVREALLNAIAHRDYRLTSEIVIKQFPKKLIINSPGGFPIGVNLENMLSINSTPRSRLMADILLKTGLVERSGQGIDKIFYLTISQGKPEPDYSHSDYFQVSLILNGSVDDKTFNVFIKQANESLGGDEKLTVNEVIALNRVRQGLLTGTHQDVIKRLESLRLVERVGSGSSQRYVLGELYQGLLNVPLKIGSYAVNELRTVVKLFERVNSVKMGLFVDAFSGSLNREQVKFLIEKLVEDDILIKKGKGSATAYQLAEQFSESPRLAVRNVEGFLSDKYEENV